MSRLGRQLLRQLFRLMLNPVTIAPLERLAVAMGHRYPESPYSYGLAREVWDYVESREVTPVRIAVLPGGPKLYFKPAFYMAWEVYFRSAFEPATTAFVLRWLKPGDTFIDVGANAGYYTLIARDVVGRQGYVHAFEPNPEIFGWLCLSIEKNAFDGNVSLNLNAVSATDRERVTLHLPAI